jgi:sorbitol-6-phosphate 2-dehydrogenase
MELWVFAVTLLVNLEGTNEMTWLGLQDKRVVVTGGTGGIGTVIVKELLTHGCSVLAVGRCADKGNDLLNAVNDSHLSFHKCDVSKSVEVKKLFQYVSESGGLYALVNNAGINIPRRLADPSGEEELSEEIWDSIIDTNQKGPFLCSQAAVKIMLKNKTSGVILNMASEAGTEGSHGQSAYAASKAALYAMSRSWAKELGEYGIRCVGLSPGVIEQTDLRSEEYDRALAYARDISGTAISSDYVRSIPLRRVGTLQEVADSVAFLISSRAGYVHGTVLNLTGGKSRA